MGLFISQIGIGLFGSVAFLLVLSDDRRKQAWGVAFGLLSNPFWWAMIFITGQWLTVPVHALYTYGWISKAWSLWKARRRKRRELREAQEYVRKRIEHWRSVGAIE